jgi:para-aminobenzoate synthetase component 1
MNEYGSSKKPFLFGVDFNIETGFFLNPDEAKKAGIYFNINGVSNFTEKNLAKKPVQLIKKPVDQKTYQSSFEIVHKNLVNGNSYLTNLTFPTPIELNISLAEIFHRSNARYRLLFGNQFVVFSPEIFIQIENGIIRSFPMKGTIDAALPNAENSILSDYKETAEHNTIVDLIRNDLSMVANEVKVERYRYIEKIVTHEKTLLQVSSEISGTLDENHLSNLGNILHKLLPAGSISGAPKKKTLQIIREAETYSRGFYTGVFGYFDGLKLDSGVMIRFISMENERMVFSSGGGITVNSNPEMEYKELIDKVYVPFI